MNTITIQEAFKQTTAAIREYSQRTDEKRMQFVNDWCFAQFQASMPILFSSSYEGDVTIDDRMAILAHIKNACDTGNWSVFEAQPETDPAAADSPPEDIPDDDDEAAPGVTDDDPIDDLEEDDDEGIPVEIDKDQTVNPETQEPEESSAPVFASTEFLAALEQALDALPANHPSRAIFEAQLQQSEDYRQRKQRAIVADWIEQFRDLATTLENTLAEHQRATAEKIKDMACHELLASQRYALEALIRNQS
jgi:hypothetical protein